jgi:hypothetical protein
VAKVLATPAAFVRAVVFDSIALAPVVGAVNVTRTFGTGFPYGSVTSTCKAVLNPELIPADWPDPAAALMEAEGPFVFVNAKLAGLATPLTAPITE